MEVDKKIATLDNRRSVNYLYFQNVFNYFKIFQAGNLQRVLEANKSSNKKVLFIKKSKKSNIYDITVDEVKKKIHLLIWFSVILIIAFHKKRHSPQKYS